MRRPQNLSPQQLQPPLPTYPLLRQIVRVDTSYNGGIYSGFVQQFASGAPRDREQSYVIEPNGIALTPGTYKARLVGSHVGPVGTLPLYAVSAACCAPTPFSSSSGTPTPPASSSAAPSSSIAPQSSSPSAIVSPSPSALASPSPSIRPSISPSASPSLRPSASPSPSPSASLFLPMQLCAGFAPNLCATIHIQCCTDLMQFCLTDLSVICPSNPTTFPVALTLTQTSPNSGVWIANFSAGIFPFRATLTCIGLGINSLVVSDLAGLNDGASYLAVLNCFGSTIFRFFAGGVVTPICPGMAFPTTLAITPGSCP
jgi:hypothetical protein